MPGKKEQKIVVFLSLTPSDKNLILHGVKIASIFSKELCLCYNYPQKQKKDKNKFKEKLAIYTHQIKKEIPGLKVSTLLFSECWKNVPAMLADDYEAVLIIAPKSGLKKYAKALAESPNPFLFVEGEHKPTTDYKTMVLPIDLRKENSDSALWASYFGRFNHTQIVVVAANDKNQENKKQVAKNVMLAKKLFQKFNLQHRIFKGDRNSLGIASEATELAMSTKLDFICILGSSAITPLDLIVGLPEKKLIRRSGELPVLAINPRKDNYILCD